MWFDDIPLTVAFGQHTIPAMNYTKEVTEGLMVKGRVGNRSFSNKEINRSRKMRIEEPVSAGGVVYRMVDGSLETVLCGRITSRSGPDLNRLGRLQENDDIKWSLAKGTPDPGESLEETALREVREETGLDVEIKQPIKSIDYWFADRVSKVRYHKTVHFYLMVPTGGDPSLHDPEFDVVEWFPFNKALESLQYTNEADVLSCAKDLIPVTGEDI